MSCVFIIAFKYFTSLNGLPWWLSGKESTCQCRRLRCDWFPGSGGFPGRGNGNPLQCSRLDDPMDRGAWWATVHEVEKESDTTEQQNNNNLFHICTSDTTDRTNNGNPRCRTGNATQCPAVTSVGRKSEREEMFECISLIHFAVQQNIVKPLYSNKNVIKNYVTRFFTFLVNNEFFSLTFPNPKETAQCLYCRKPC